ncbi:hypothetical protein [Fibrobacter sp. UWB10]|uniref:hypothetical protein n=1 Tax=Fibrobacter sp. UWB10 TaxID=1896201 RepID=UPI0024037C79|nr:hypothetical protein [Fibrobacter sp. UWB10]SMP40402.1 hypothetical protein SAMN05720465_0492 [Fibrobacter sp. UWB10]
MKKLYYIRFAYPKMLNGTGKYVASSKATQDVSDILQRHFKVKDVLITRHFLNKILGSIEFLFMFFLALRKIPKGSNVFIQYPLINLGIFKYCYRSLAKYNAITIVHDLQSYRFPHFEHFRQLEINILNQHKHVIVHSQNMKKRLVLDGVRTHIVVLELFDYLLDDSNKAIEQRGTIIFAGALEKSVFLKDLKKIDFGKMLINLYGGTCPKVDLDECVRYRGKFLPSDVSSIEGEWGLLWDGDSAFDCVGNFGEYLTLIAPHKLSLYLACGFKVIVWEKSAMAEFVAKNHLGVLVKSLAEIPEKLSRISPDENEIILRNVKKISNQIRHGEMFRKALNTCLEV